MIERDLETAVRNIEQFVLQSEKENSSLLKRIFSIGKGLVSQETLLQSLDVLKAHQTRAFTLFPQLIARYNALLEEPTSWRERAIRFLRKKSGRHHKIELSTPLTVQSGARIEALRSNILVGQRELDLFRMKAITLIQKQAPLFSSIGEIVQCVRKAPVASASMEGGRITLYQRLSPLPGEVIELAGGSLPGEPLKVASRATQTGFPHPSQHTGWALADALLANSPLRFEKLPLWESLYQRKRKAAAALLPQGAWNTRAKQLLREKRKLFEENAPTLLTLHKELAELLGVPTTFHSLDSLIETWEEAIAASITRPTEALQHTWETHGTLSFTNWPTTRLSIAVREILLQQWSEKTGQKAIPLTPFAKKIQLATYRQLERFLDELENGPQDPTRQLKEELALFRSKRITPSPLVKEITRYYHDNF